MTVQSTWNELVSKNPMLIEIARFRRKFLSLNGNNAVGSVILAIVGILYLGFVALIVTYRKDIDPIILVAVQMTLFAILAPTLLHSAIAGERERRSWDLLLAAPITKGQIVVGKFIGALSAVGIGTTFFVFPIAVTALSYQGPINRGANVWNLVIAELLCLSFTVLVCAITLFFSARVKTAFMALGATLGFLAVSVIFLPTIIEVLTGGSGQIYDDTLMFLHPAYAFGRIAEASNNNGLQHGIPAAWFGVPQILVYLGLSAIVLAWSINTLTFAENEVKFIPKGKS